MIDLHLSNPFPFAAEIDLTIALLYSVDLRNGGYFILDR